MPKNTSQLKEHSKKFNKKYSQYLDDNEKSVRSWYHYIISTNSKGEFIERTFFPETKQITSKTIYTNEFLKIRNGLQQNWYDNGHKLSEGNYKLNKEDGEWNYFYHSTGTLKQKGEFVEGKKNGKWINYDLKERISSYYTFLDNKKNGKFIQYDTLGGIINQGEYRLDSIISQTISKVNENEKFNETMPYLKQCENIDSEARKKCSDQTLLKYIYSNLKYPMNAREYGIEGNAVANFVINKNGELEDIQITRGLCQSIKDECFKVINNLPQWHPGTQNGEPVNVYYTLPIRFKLN